MAKLIEYIKFHMARKIGEPFYSWIIAACNKKRSIQVPEKVQHPGTLYPEQTFYLIRINYGSPGLASYYDSVLGYLESARKKRYIPVIDLGLPENFAIYDTMRKGNPWEYYYKQPLCGDKRYTLEDALAAQNLVYADPGQITLYKRNSRREIARRRRMADLIPYNEETMQYLKEKECDILPESEEAEIIGAYYRGTDYKQYGKWKPLGHAVVPTIERFAADLQSYCAKVGCRTIFFMTDEQEAVEYMQKAMAGTYELRFIDHPRYSNFHTGKEVSWNTPENLSRFENNRFYLMDLDILSKCTYLFGTENGGMQMAKNMNGNRYKDIHILDYGIY